MKRRPTMGAVLGAAIALGSAWAMALAGDEPPTAAESDLATEVARLRERVAELEKRLAELEERQPRVFTVPEATPDLVPRRVWPYPNGPRYRPPRAWGEGEVNGIPYYYLPLQEGDAERGSAAEHGPPPVAPSAAP